MIDTILQVQMVCTFLCSYALSPHAMFWNRNHVDSTKVPLRTATVIDVTLAQLARHKGSSLSTSQAMGLPIAIRVQYVDNEF